METKANHILVGIFTVIVGALGFGFIYWLARFEEAAGEEPIIIVFEEAVTGLTAGGDVLFNGIKVGEVARLAVDPDDPKRVRTLVHVQTGTPVKPDTVARLELQGLTGVAVVQLLGGSPGAETIGVGPEGEIPVIIAEPSQLKKLLDTVSDIAEKGSSLFARLDRVLGTNEEAIDNSLANVEKFTETLAANSERFDSFMRDVSAFASRLDGMSEGLDELVKGINSLIGEGGGEMMKNIGSTFQRIDAFLAENEAPLKETIKNIDTFSSTLASNTEEFDKFMKDASELATRLNSVSVKLEAVVTRADTLLGEEGSGLVKDARSAFSRIDSFLAENSESFGKTIKNAETFTTVLSENSEQVGNLITDANALAQKLNKVGDDIDKLVARVSGMVETDAAGFLTDAREAAATFRQLAADLSEQLGTATEGIERATGRGVRELESFLAEGRTTFRTIQSFVERMERNPQRFLSGRSQVPEYTPR
ncbi:MAG: MlaD family protein [Hyphomicrobiales bacterium]|nr:MlaD family protein [Hyphomicrobiales bacterium]